MMCRHNIKKGIFDWKRKLKKTDEEA